MFVKNIVKTIALGTTLVCANAFSHETNQAKVSDEQLLNQPVTSFGGVNDLRNVLSPPSGSFESVVSIETVFLRRFFCIRLIM